MKRFILLPLLPLVLLSALQAQTLYYGFKAGPQTTSMTHVSDGKMALQYHAGILAGVALMDRLDAQAELLFSAQGLNDSESDDYKQRNLYLQLPVMAKARVWKGLGLHAGLQIGYLLGAKLKIDDDEDQFSYSNKEDYKKVNLSTLLGAEYALFPKLNVGLRMNWGVSPVFQDYERSRHRMFQVFASYTFQNRDF